MEKPFILDTDFSRMAAGGVLALVQGEQEGFMACFLKSLDAAQQKYHALEKNIVFKKQIFGKTISSKKDCYVFV